MVNGWLPGLYGPPGALPIHSDVGAVLPHALQTNRGSISESLTSSAQRFAMTAIEWLQW